MSRTGGTARPQNNGVNVRSISIIGAGPAGLILGIGLVRAGYDVTLYSDRAPEAIRSGFVPSSAGLSFAGQAVEAELGLNTWDDRVQELEGVHFDVVAPGGDLVTTIEGPWHDGPWRCVDLRLKCFSWMAEFERLGGRVVVREITPDDLERCAAHTDLTVVAAGKGKISSFFARDDEKCIFAEPQRNISMVVVKDHPGWVDAVGFAPLHYTKMLDVGEVICGTFLNTDEEPAIFLIFDAVPGSPMDRFMDVSSNEEQVEVSKQFVKECMPWEWERVKDMRLADPGAAIRGRITPTVRKPVAKLPSGALLTGVGDTLSTKDGIGGQGLNSAVKSGHHMLKAILDRGDKAFDAEWIQHTWDDFWNTYEQYADVFNNGLMMPVPVHQQKIFAAAARNPELARKLFHCFSHPPSAFPWMVDPAAAEEVLAQVER